MRRPQPAYPYNQQSKAAVTKKGKVMKYERTCKRRCVCEQRQCVHAAEGKSGESKEEEEEGRRGEDEKAPPTRGAPLRVTEGGVPGGKVLAQATQKQGRLCSTCCP